MDGQSRRKIDMGMRALEFSRAHPDSEPGAPNVVARLEQLVTRANAAATAQRDGLIQVHAASVRRKQLRREMLAGPIAHLAQVGRAAAREQHELGNAFRFKPGADTILAFRTAARSMAGAAQEHREVLLKYGLSQSVLDEFIQQLDELDATIALGYEGRAGHVGASRELRDVSSQIVGSVRVMHGRNRQRFAEDGQLFGSWLNVSRVSRTPRPDTKPEDERPGGGEVRPAA
ncbi:MAG TPA: hypothetical protein VFH40_07045 [Gemmatimonadales bacterium]|jgi:hypothetical protein|nr:hypothetical protein [Gemmatimonadales bacterium]